MSLLVLLAFFFFYLFFFFYNPLGVRLRQSGLVARLGFLAARRFPNWEIRICESFVVVLLVVLLSSWGLLRGKDRQ